MKIGDVVYLVSDQLSPGSGIPGKITRLRDSIAEIAIQGEKDPTALTVQDWDVLPANLYTQAVLKTVYRTVQSLELECGSLFYLESSEIIRKLVEHGLSVQIARECVDLFDSNEWKTARLPLYQWLRKIKDFYYQKQREERTAA